MFVAVNKTEQSLCFDIVMFFIRRRHLSNCRISFKSSISRHNRFKGFKHWAYYRRLVVYQLRRQVQNSFGWFTQSKYTEIQYKNRWPRSLSLFRIWVTGSSVKTVTRIRILLVPYNESNLFSFKKNNNKKTLF